jgi:GNAT superfamily N-acetyltransferase
MDKRSDSMEWQHHDVTLTDDPDRIDVGEVCNLLRGTYWAEKRAYDVIERSVRQSLSFAILREGKLIGFARVVTDRATVGYLCDFVIAKEFRARGLGRWVLARILEHPHIEGCRIDLFTRDAQEFYRGFGFGPHRFTSMVRYPAESVKGQDPGVGPAGEEGSGEPSQNRAGRERSG